MERYQYQLKCALNIDPSDFDSVNERLEIVIPCINCERTNRTIVFERVGEKGICTPMGKCSGFAGTLIDRTIIEQVGRLVITYRINFDYEPFIDRKYMKPSDLQQQGWARVSFTAKCSKCTRKKGLFSQENIGRPWVVKCKCGHLIYQDIESPFEYTISKVQ